MSLPETAGQIVILNGPPLSGKSSIAAAIQARFDGAWMNLGVDRFKQMTLHHDDYSVPLRILGTIARQLSGSAGAVRRRPVPVEVALRRRRAAWGGVGYNQGGSVSDPVSRWHEAVHKPGIYDLEVDTSVLRPEQCADLIADRLAQAPPPSAFARLAGGFTAADPSCPPPPDGF